MLARDHELYCYLAARGYAGARVDIRGTGQQRRRACPRASTPSRSSATPKT